MNVPECVPRRFKVDPVRQGNEITTGPSTKDRIPPPVERTRHPYEVMLSGLSKHGSTFTLTFNSYEVEAERQGNERTETITRYYSNNCVLVETSREFMTPHARELIQIPLNELEGW